MTFDFEKLEVYRLSLVAIDQCMSMVVHMPRGNGNLADQLKRAVSSIALNISEGTGEFKPLEKARFYRIALRSVAETCAIVQIAQRLKIVRNEPFQETYELLTRIAKMLTKLIASVEQRNKPGMGIGMVDRVSFSGDGD